MIQSADAAPIVDEPASDAIAIEEIAEPSDAPQELRKGVARGKSKRFEAGAPHGVWIWHDGNSWHVRTTTKANKHRFTGFVAPSKDVELDNVSTSRSELKDRVKLKGDRLRFDFTTNGHADGFDFRARGEGCVRFAVKVDGTENGGVVKLGEEAVQPTSWHFKLCS